MDHSQKPRYPENEGLQYNPVPVDESQGLQHDSSRPAQFYSSKFDIDGIGKEILPNSRDSSICGVKRRLFWIFIVVLVVVVAGALGGGVGGVVAHNARSHKTDNTDANRSSQTTSSSITTQTTPQTIPQSTGSSSSSLLTSSTTSSSATASATNDILALDCPGLNNTIVTLENDTFRIVCDGNLNTNGADIIRTLASSLDECLDFCISTNNSTSVETPCVGIVFAANQASAVAATGSNCFLKATTGTLEIGKDLKDFLAAGILLSAS